MELCDVLNESLAFPEGLREAVIQALPPLYLQSLLLDFRCTPSSPPGPQLPAQLAQALGKPFQEQEATWQRNTSSVTGEEWHPHIPPPSAPPSLGLPFPSAQIPHVLR